MYTKKLARVEYRGILISMDTVVHFKYEQCGILPHTLATLAVGNTVTTYPVLPTYDTKKYDVQKEWNVTKSGHQYHT